MGSKYDARQGIDGIVTLTNDPLAKDNIKRFRIGERVICNDDGVIGTVKELDTKNKACIVDFDDGQESLWIEDDQLSPIE